MKYAEFYCMKDCKVLKKGYNTFRNWILEALDIDINNKWTTASFADNYLKKQGCYDDVYALSGNPQRFIMKCVVGGRTMMNSNKMSKFDSLDKNSDDYGKKMSDFDAVSLYPSAMDRMNGFLQGIPKILKQSQKNMKFLEKCDGYFIKIKVLKVNKKRQFPLLSSINDDGVRVFSNDMENTIHYVDRYSFEDLIKFQDIDYEIMQGYYYDEGRNNKIKEVINFLFNERLKKKKEHNPIQMVYKLVMNSSYGKSILKPIVDKEVIISDNKFRSYLIRNYNFIKEFSPMYQVDNFKQNWRIKEHKSINEHFNFCSVGVEILSMSKRIMNEVMCLGEDLNLKMYYQDTDSIHINYDDIDVLKKEFKKVYGRELEGKKLGQLHIDFDLKDDNGNDCKNIYAEKSIFLGKKCYLDCLVGEGKDGKIYRGHHIRLKGVPNSTIKYTAKKMNVSLYGLYDMLYRGEKIRFDLLEGGKRVNFKFLNSGVVINMPSFHRDICFLKNKQERKMRIPKNIKQFS